MSSAISDDMEWLAQIHENLGKIHPASMMITICR